MSEKVRSLIDVSAVFLEACIRKAGRGIVEGIHSAARLIFQVGITALAVTYALQMLDAQKACNAAAPVPPASHIKHHKTVSSKPDAVFLGSEKLMLNREGN